MNYPGSFLSIAFSPGGFVAFAVALLFFIETIRYALLYYKKPTQIGFQLKDSQTVFPPLEEQSFKTSLAITEISSNHSASINSTVSASLSPEIKPRIA